MRSAKKNLPSFALDLAAAVRKQRKVLKLTQIALGKFAGCGADFIYDLENGKPTVRLDKLIDVLTILGLQLTLEPGKQVLKISERLR